MRLKPAYVLTGEVREKLVLLVKGKCKVHQVAVTTLLFDPIVELFNRVFELHLELEALIVDAARQEILDLTDRV